MWIFFIVFLSFVFHILILFNFLFTWSFSFSNLMFHIEVRDFWNWNPNVRLKKNEKKKFRSSLRNLWKLHLQNIYIHFRKKKKKTKNGVLTYRWSQKSNNIGWKDFFILFIFIFYFLWTNFISLCGVYWPLFSSDSSKFAKN